MKNDEKFKIRSEEVQELISTPPAWIIRWGLTILLLIIGAMIISSMVVEVPEYVEVPCKVSFVDEYSVVKAHKTGTVEEVLFTKNQVSENEELITINDCIVNSPKDGYIMLYKPVYKGQNIAASDTLMYVINEESELLINLNIPREQYGKVKKGQQLLIENGELLYECTLQSIENVSNKPFYQAVAIVKGKDLLADTNYINGVVNAQRAKILITKKSPLGSLM